VQTTRRRFLQTSGLAAGTLFPSGRLGAQARRAMPDVIVLLPGIMGSVLQKDGRDVWALSGSALMSAIRSVGASVTALALSGDAPDREDLGDGIVATRLVPDAHLLPGFWKIDGYSRIANAIREEFDVEPGRNYFEFPYDWRRDNRAAARRLARVAPGWLRAWRERSGKRDARLILVCHSMGGLVARYFLEALDGWRDARSLVTFGTPYRGSLNALNTLANGFRRTIGPFTIVDLTSLVRSFTSTYQLLPIYPCYDDGGGTLRRVADANGIPNVEAARASAALAFHDEMRHAHERNAGNARYADGRYVLHPIVGTYQPTLQVGRRSGDAVIMSDRHPSTALRGDGTVPQVSATPIEIDTFTARQRTVFVAEQHGSLQNSAPMLDHLRALITEGDMASDAFRAGTRRAMSLEVEDVYAADSPVRVRVG
jgi:lecithin:cholesterol acyltransferase